VAATFRENGHGCPLIDNDGRKCLVTERIIKLYTKLDPAVKRQPPLPLSVFRKLFATQDTHLHVCLGQLAIGALFFGCRSCEYLKVDNNELNDRQTKILRLRNIVFRKQGIIVRSSFVHVLRTADCVSITFEDQKNGEKMETVTQHKSGHNICPVFIWADIFARVINYRGTSLNSPVYTFQENGRLYSLTSKIMRQHLRETTTTIGCDSLGINNVTDVGTHSIRASFAMMLHLNKIADSTIMQMGRWKSDAFLVYIRKQVNTYGFNVSKRMFGTASDNFFLIPHLSGEKTNTNKKRRRTQKASTRS
jgi:hypothetical protein